MGSNRKTIKKRVTVRSKSKRDTQNGKKINQKSAKKQRVQTNPKRTEQDIDMDLPGRYIRADRILWGLKRSQHNVVVFNNTPEVWFQYYLGLYFEMPTIIIIRKRDKACKKILKHKLVWGFIDIDEFNNKTTEYAAEQAKKIITENTLN